jgi:uncharacterized zinc-type alcohol dehydrogenase-like protein
MTITEHFAVKIPAEMPLEKAGPIMCAGITMFDPLVEHGCMGGKKRVGIAGIGGLGQTGIILALAMGCEVTAISSSNRKEALCKELGVTNFVAMSDPEAVAAAANSVDVILDTVPVEHDSAAYMSLLDYDGALCVLGIDINPHKLSAPQFMFHRRNVSGSAIGGIRRTQELINFCAEKAIYPTIEIVPCSEINTVYDKLRKSNDTGVRYVLDIKNTMADFK